ncbi:tRNA-specific adenosine deaminase [bioreactor metagenome]|uniref:tRNA-specific adenosine deaminase 2 n=1 Tax=bioreactor metagenome TaxID=1076179 RepID=A0A645AN29_9ZZZZ
MSNIYLARDFMEMAIQEAQIAQSNNDVPIGAVIVYKGDIISKAHNKVILSNDPLAHAEMLAISAAMKSLGQKNLSECDLYVTLEPCPMCAGAIVLARIRRVYIGTEDTKTGAAGSVYNILQDQRLNHCCEVYNGIGRDKCSSLISNFFVELRDKKRKIKYE